VGACEKSASRLRSGAQMQPSMRRNFWRKLALQSGYRNGFSVELRYPIHVTVVISGVSTQSAYSVDTVVVSTQSAHSATTVKQTKYGRKQTVSYAENASPNGEPVDRQLVRVVTA